MFASGRYAMLDDGMGFSLVPWRPVIEQRLGQQLAAMVRRRGVVGDGAPAWIVDWLAVPRGYSEPVTSITVSRTQR